MYMGKTDSELAEAIRVYDLFKDHPDLYKMKCEKELQKLKRDKKTLEYRITELENILRAPVTQ